MEGTKNKFMKNINKLKSLMLRNRKRKKRTSGGNIDLGIPRAALVYACEDGIKFRKYSSVEEARKAMQLASSKAKLALESNNYNDDSFQAWQVIDYSNDIDRAIRKVTHLK